MSFGMTNAPATFMTLMIGILRPFPDDFVVVNLDDILIYSRPAEEHTTHRKNVLSVLRANQLYAKLSKCDLAKTEVSFSGHMVGARGIHMEPGKMDVIRKWPRPTNPTEVRSFLGLVSFYRRYILRHSFITAPLTDLTVKGIIFKWELRHEVAFIGLKAALTFAPVILTPNPYGDFGVTTDASSYAIGAVLQQEHEGELRPVAFESRKLSPAEQGYATHELETLAIIHSLRQWRCYLLGRKVVVYTDHMSLKYLMTQPNTSHQDRSDGRSLLAAYDMEIRYKPGKENVIADALSSRLHARQAEGRGLGRPGWGRRLHQQTVRPSRVSLFGPQRPGL